ncbi:MAG: tetratricopeptide repeat protein, partial [Adlercreutzia sp.]
GMAYASLHDYEDAVKHFEIAVSDAKYDASYKAYSGMGNALLKLGKSAEAGVAFREAALDEANPDPTKALLNLGVCFMALDRPADAVASYESALQFDMQPDTRNKLYANLGQAYVACGQMQKAVNAFEQSIADKTYFLSDSASVDYQRAIAAVAQGTSEITQVMAPVAPVADMSGLDVAADGTAVYVDQDPYAAGGQEPYYYADPYAQAETNPYGARARRIISSTPATKSWSSGRRVSPSRIASAATWVSDPRHHHPDRAGRFRRRRVPVHAGLGLSVAGPGGRAAVLGSKAAFASEVTEENAASMTELLSTVGSPATTAWTSP